MSNPITTLPKSVIMAGGGDVIRTQWKAAKQLGGLHPIKAVVEELKLPGHEVQDLLSIASLGFWERKG